MYLNSNNLAFKVLLILDNAQRQLQDVLAQMNTEGDEPFTIATSLLQPSNLGIITIHKTLYTRHTFCNVLDACEKIFVSLRDLNHTA